CRPAARTRRPCSSRRWTRRARATGASCWWSARPGSGSRRCSGRCWTRLGLAGCRPCWAGRAPTSAPRCSGPGRACWAAPPRGTGDSTRRCSTSGRCRRPPTPAPGSGRSPTPPTTSPRPPATGSSWPSRTCTPPTTRRWRSCGTWRGRWSRPADRPCCSWPRPASRSRTGSTGRCRPSCTSAGSGATPSASCCAGAPAAIPTTPRSTCSCGSAPAIPCTCASCCAPPTSASPRWPRSCSAGSRASPSEPGTSSR
ncbi:MAG: hypothetical protein AVDCRST_MAG54-3075, partial [uncultured Actinomycetospora sp.]